ncbi:hypothetical protein LUZ60_015921 [Juncus effusus]|nr:hypothetical protein LUZ60_015921 [Juncus effusus]
MSGLVAWLNNKIVDPLLQILKKGAEPKVLAFSTALGITIGVFPIFGVTVFLCGFAIAVLRDRCHGPTVMLFNFIVTPLEISLVIPFLRLGEGLSGGAQFPLSKDAFKLIITGQASSELLFAVFNALLGWFVASPFILGAIYFATIPCFKYLVKKFRPPSSPKTPIQASFSETKIKI